MNDLTTDAAVIAYEPRVAALDQVSVRDPVRVAVSDRMTRWMSRRHISPTVSVDQYELASGMERVLALNDWPAAGLTITRAGGDQLEAEDFRVSGDRNVEYLVGGASAYWPRGEFLLSYTAGYDAVSIPEVLQNAATWQTAFELLRLEQQNLGIDQREPQTGATETLTPEGFLTSVMDAMKAYRAIG